MLGLCGFFLLSRIILRRTGSSGTRSPRRAATCPRWSWCPRSGSTPLQRARTSLASLPEHQRPGEVEPANADLLAKYVDAFQRYDMKALITLLREDALQTMPPLEMWIQGASAITTWMTQPGPSACAGSILVPVRANGVVGWAQYKPDPEHGGYAPWALQVHEITGGKISRMTFFLDTERLFPLFGLQDRIFDDR